MEKNTIMSRNATGGYTRWEALGGAGRRWEALGGAGRRWEALGGAVGALSDHWIC